MDQRVVSRSLAKLLIFLVVASVTSRSTPNQEPRSQPVSQNRSQHHLRNVLRVGVINGCSPSAKAERLWHHTHPRKWFYRPTWVQRTAVEERHLAPGFRDSFVECGIHDFCDQSSRLTQVSTPCGGRRFPTRGALHSLSREGLQNKPGPDWRGGRFFRRHLGEHACSVGRKRRSRRS